MSSPTIILRGHSSPVTALALDPQSTPSRATLASADTDGTARIWDVTAGICTRGLRCKSQRAAAEEDDGAGAVAWLSPNTVIVALGPTVRAFDLRAPGFVLTNPESGCTEDAADDINCLAVSDRGTYLATADDSGAVGVTDLRTNRPFKRFRSRHDNLATSVAFHPTKSYEIWSTSMDCTVKRWDFSRGTCMQTFDANAAAAVNTTSSTAAAAGAQTINPRFANSVAIHSSGFAAAGLGDGSVATWEVPERIGRRGARIEYGEMERREEAHGWAVTAVAFPSLPGPPRLLSASLDGVIASWGTHHHQQRQPPSDAMASAYTSALASCGLPAHRVATIRKIDCMAVLPPTSDESVLVALGGPLRDGVVEGTAAEAGPRHGDIETYLVQV
ncbi:WD repeat-containing protein 53 [Geranomyces michiganensis]|nr:WD repeat-containing protein 53 [Geranomyces michiganensis]